MKRALLLFITAFAMLCPAADMMTMNVTLVAGTSDCPMIVAWLVNDQGKYVKTLHMFSKDYKYFKDMTSWFKSRGSAEKNKELDAAIGPTIKWKGNQTCSIPINVDGINLLNGSYTIRIEQNKDKAGHYKSTKIPLPSTFSGATLADEGYIKSLVITVK